MTKEKIAKVSMNANSFPKIKHAYKIVMTIIIFIKINTAFHLLISVIIKLIQMKKVKMYVLKNAQVNMLKNIIIQNVS
jgi:hypothetical protein